MVWGYHPRRVNIRVQCPLKYGSAWVVSAVLMVTRMPVKSYELLGYYRPTLTRIGDAQLYWSGRYAPLAFIRSLPDCFRFGIVKVRCDKVQDQCAAWHHAQGIVE